MSGRSKAQRAGWLLSKSALAAALRITGIAVHYMISLGECDRTSLGLFVLNELAHFTLEGNSGNGGPQHTLSVPTQITPPACTWESMHCQHIGI